MNISTLIEQRLLSSYKKQVVLSEYDEAAFVYGIRTILADFKKIAVLYSISILLDCFIETLCIHIIFLTFRQVTFGLHSASFIKCLIISCLVFQSFALTLHHIEIPLQFTWAIFLVAGGILYRFAPIGSVKHSIRSSKHHAILRKQMYVRLVILAFVLLWVPASIAELFVAGLSIQTFTILLSQFL